MYAKADEEYEMTYLDFDSLYPSVNYEAEYMLGHPTPHTWHKKVQWTCSDHMKCPITGKRLRGWVKVKARGRRGMRMTVCFYVFENAILIDFLEHPSARWTAAHVLYVLELHQNL